jgi:hypothetical protein
VAAQRAKKPKEKGEMAVLPCRRESEEGEARRGGREGGGEGGPCRRVGSGSLRVMFFMILYGCRALRVPLQFEVVCASAVAKVRSGDGGCGECQECSADRGLHEQGAAWAGVRDWEAAKSSRA